MKKELTFNTVIEWLKKLKTLALIIFIGTIFICGVLFLYTLIFMSPGCGCGKLICDFLGVEDKKSAVEFLGSVLTTLGFGSLALLGIWVANRRAAAMERTAQAQADGATEQANAVKETEKGRRQERFRDAVNHLGNEFESVRLGGAYALFHLALEEESLRQSIAEILCAHIRETTRCEQYRKDYANQPSTEIQSLMALLFKGIGRNRSESLKQFWSDSSPDLSECFFRGLKLTKAQFQGAQLSNTLFQGASLTGARFQGAILKSTQFQKARLLGGQFQGAHLFNANFQGSNLWGAQFQGASLENAQFQLTNLNGSALSEMLDDVNHSIPNTGYRNFLGPFLSSLGDSLGVAQFQGASLFEAKFQGAWLDGVQFQGASCQSAPAISFEMRVRNGIGRVSNLSDVTFKGGLTESEVNDIFNQLEGIILEHEIVFPKRRLQEHVGQRASNIPPEGVETGEYSQEEADQWIVEYEKAMNWEKDA